MNTNYFINCVAGNLFKTKTSPPIPDSLYIGLSTTPPNINGTGTSEPPTSAGYSRVRLTDLCEPNSGSVANTQPISFPESTADWGIITHFVIFDSQTVGSGNLLMYGQLSTPRSVEQSTVMIIKKGSLNLSVKSSD